jgi:hypothetical protein
MFYNPSTYAQLSQSLVNQPPFAIAQTLSTSASQLLTLENGFPATSQASVPNTIAVNPDYKVGYAQTWNFSIQTAIRPNTSLIVTYTGTKGTDLAMLYGLSGALNTSQLASGQTSSISNAQGFTYATYGGNSIYNGLQVRLQHRMGRGLMINGIYTFSKSIDNASTIGGGTAVIVQDLSDLQAERGLSSFDMRHQFRLNYTYEFPLGDRHRFAQRGVSALLVGNWRLSGNIALHSGSPYTARVFDSSCQVLPGTYSERADQVGDPNLPSSQQTPLHFFNTAAFIVPAGTCVGNAARNTITGPSGFTWNAQLAKTFAFGRDQTYRLDLRWEITNLTNTPSFTGLSTVVNSTTFGRVLGAGPMRAMSFTTRLNF